MPAGTRSQTAAQLAQTLRTRSGVPYGRPGPPARRDQLRAAVAAPAVAPAAPHVSALQRRRAANRARVRAANQARRAAVGRDDAAAGQNAPTAGAAAAGKLFISGLCKGAVSN